MKSVCRRTVFLSFLCLCMAGPLFAQKQLPSFLAYIEQYRDIAIAQQREHGIPASITMAQGLLESGAGQSDLARKAHNHFGIKCTSDWKGDSYRHDDDRKQECFRKYRHARESYEDHSKFLLRDRYKSLFSLPLTDYKGWAAGLSKCGYATDPKYPEKLIKIIEDYRLDLLVADAPAKHAKTKSTPKDTIFAADTVEIVQKEDFSERAKMDDVNLYHDHQSGRQNGVRYIIARQGETFASLAYFLNMSERTLRRYNDALDGRELRKGDRVYLFPKRRRADRKHPTYYIRKGDTAWSVSQKFGIKMKSLYKLNGIPENVPLTTSQMLRLR